MPAFNLKENVQRSDLDIVLIGSFNPVIITPAWLANKGLIRESEANEALVKLIHPEIVEYQLEWVTLNITQKRFQIKCNSEPYFEITRDLVTGILSYLKETPVTSFGFNHGNIIDLKTKERIYELGNKLCPLQNWNNFLHEPRLQKMEIIEADSKFKDEGSVQITIFAAYDPTFPFSFGITINDHYNFSISKDGKPFSYRFILDYWDNSINIQKSVLENLAENLNL